MFTEFKIDGDAEEPYVDVKVYERALPLLNKLESWVRYALAEFRDLKSSYAKNNVSVTKTVQNHWICLFFLKKTFLNY